MKIKFQNDLSYQQDALSAVIEVFKGQEKLKSNFTVVAPRGDSMKFDDELGYANKLSLTPSALKKNVQDTQLKNGLKVSEPGAINVNDLQFSVEMETGTGKTYVFTRSILEMNKRYGFTKFVIVVPSVSIREGIYKSLQLTEEHFRKEFDNVPYKYFIYDSSNLSEIRDFASSNQIRVMIINTQSFAARTQTEQKNKRIFLEYNDKLGARPISLVQNTNPVVFVDEPQSAMSSDLQKKSIKELNPLAIYRFSATHKEVVNMLYKFDAVDAYNGGMVKKIEVASITTQDEVSDGAYIHLKAIKRSGKSGITAKVMVDVRGKGGKVNRKEKTLRQGTDLYEITKLEQYFGYIANEISFEPEFVEFTNGKLLRPDETLGGLDDAVLKRRLIRKTIEEHLNKEVRLNPKGIKVLSLFFIDAVDKYRTYDEDGNDGLGLYAQVFEEEYNRLIQRDKYQILFKNEIDTETPAAEVHKGYFSIDKKKKKSNKKENFEYFKDTKGTTKADEDTYQLIMKDKERLLSFEEPARFIFSHSALKEGWDNPNVFQICLLKDMGASKIRRRQEIGRGLRIPVDSDGNRVYDENINVLTATINETFKDFVEGYQKELTEDTGIEFGRIAVESFNNVVIEMIETEDGEQKPVYLGQEKSAQIHQHFIEQGYIQTNGKVQDALKLALKENQVDLGQEFEEPVQKQILKVIKDIAGSLEIEDSEDRRDVKINKEVYLSEDFKALWDSIKYKTLYQVNFDSNQLVQKCIASINTNLMRQSTSVNFEKGLVNIDASGVSEAEDTYRTQTENLNTEVKYLPDIITYLQEETDLTRRTIVNILTGIEKHLLGYFKVNPQLFIEQCTTLINLTKRSFIVDGIQYQKMGEEAYYAQKRIMENEMIGYLNKQMVASSKSVYEYTVCDSKIEENLTKEFEQSENIKLYTKLPSWFKVPTPLGDYNPDWAILYNKNNDEKLYFVTESKGTLFKEGLRPTEKLKIDCGEAHFEALNSRMIVATTINDIHNQV